MFSPMRTIGSPAELERRRLLAVERVNEGYSTEEVAEFLGIDARSVRRWVSLLRRDGVGGLRARPVPGRPPKLTPTQEKLVARWLADNPTEYGFATELWTAPRLAQLIEQEGGVASPPGYLCQGRRGGGFTPQKPRRGGRERDDRAIAAWRAQDWPRIKKRPAAGAPTSFSLMKAGC